MLRDWLSRNINLREKLIVVEAELSGNGVGELCAYLIARKGKSYSTVKKFTAIEPKQLQKELGIDNPVLIHFRGPSILRKELQGISPEELSVEKILPASDADEFLLQTVSKEGSITAWVMRRSSFEELFQPLAALGFRIAGIFLGSSVDELYQSESDLSTPAGEHKIATVFDKESQYISMPLHPGLQHSLTEERHRKRFERVVQLGLTLFILAFIANKLVVYQYAGKLATLEVQQVMAGGADQETRDLAKELETKKELASLLGYQRQGEISIYSDQIGALIPLGMKLTQLNILGKGEKSNKEVKSVNNTIQILGKTDDAESISQLNSDLGKLNWVRKSTVSSINENEGISSFSIQLEVNP